MQPQCPVTTWTAWGAYIDDEAVEGQDEGEFGGWCCLPDYSGSYDNSTISGESLSNGSCYAKANSTAPTSTLAPAAVMTPLPCGVSGLDGSSGTSTDSWPTALSRLAPWI